MTTGFFSPRPEVRRPCTTCLHYRGPASTCGTAALCAHRATPDKWTVQAIAANGCAFWTEDTRKPVRLIVCGGRDYNDRGAVIDALDQLLEKRRVTLVIHGAAPGADTLAGEWAKMRGIEAQACPAEWGKHGKRAGPLRNAHMLTLEPDGVVAFPGGRGTDDMVMRAHEAGVPVWHPYG